MKHQRLWEALRRHGVPAPLVQSAYAKTLFRFTAEGTSSGWQRQERGIRQGCPLSPYLFVLAMSALWEDVKMECFIRGTQRGLWDLSFGEIWYADDTALVVDTEEQAQSILMVLETVARTYGLNLDRGKCEMLAMGEWRQIPFDTPDGHLLRAAHGKYLGRRIYANGDMGREVRQRIGNTHHTWQRLGIFWEKRVVCGEMEFKGV